MVEDIFKNELNNNKDIVTAFSKGLSVITAFDNNNTHMKLSDVAKKINITRASARRLLLTLESLGYVSQNENLFSLTPKIIDLGYSYFASLPWTDLAYKNMKRIVDECKLSCSIAILDSSSVICIMRIPSTRILNEGIHVGSRLPAAYSATGRLFMSYMNDEELYNYIKTLQMRKMATKSIISHEKLYKKIISERNLGYQMIEEELEDGLISFSAPIFNRNNKIIGAMNIGTHTSYKSKKVLLETVLPLLMNAANDTTSAIKLLHQY